VAHEELEAAYHTQLKLLLAPTRVFTALYGWKNILCSSKLTCKMKQDSSSTAMSNRNCLLGQTLCHDL